ncbi:MAG: hypothetical protein U5L08_14540 [Xanthomonadales bacterium]|nr:hypothetical protein [Xanthomonadales bacterium]
MCVVDDLDRVDHAEIAGHRRALEVLATLDVGLHRFSVEGSAIVERDSLAKGHLER